MAGEVQAQTAGIERFYFGPCGWSYPDWAGVVYPPGVSRRFDPLSYLAPYFDAIEVNVSFYRPVAARTSASWVRRVSSHARFQFAFKLHQSFTHDRAAYSPEDVRTFIEGVRPVAESGRLGCVLMQFPWSFRHDSTARGWLRRLADDFGALPLVAELRHDSWSGDETRAMLREWGVGYCNIDQPALRQCIGPTATATSDVGYVRLHGRRTDTWFAKDTPGHERYNYLYSERELEEWIPRIRDVAAKVERVYVFTNNHYRGQAPANALQLKAMIAKRPVAVPDMLLSHFPALASIADRPDFFPETLL